MSGMGDKQAGRWQALILISAGVVGALSTWFSATAVLPELTLVFGVSDAAAAWLTTSVQLGFVAGALAASIVNLPDIVRMQRLIAVSAAVAGISNLLLLSEPPFLLALVLRFLTGAALAGVYPPALKLVATWFLSGRGLAMGAMVGALTLGSALPHLFRGLSDGLDWRFVMVGSSLATIASAVLFAGFVREGPHGLGRATFDPRQIVTLLGSRPVMLANVGYFGHMWELYAMWAWITAFLSAALSSEAGDAQASAPILGFVIIAAGTIGCLLGGVLSDRIGRCLTTIAMMAVSAGCALAIGFAFGGPTWILLTIAVVWGVTVVGDSAQFSAAVSELVDKKFTGTALTLQMGIGFAITIVAISVIPAVVEWMGSWQWTFLVLLPGPILGIWAMTELRRLPEAERLAGGRR